MINNLSQILLFYRLKCTDYKETYRTGWSFKSKADQNTRIVFIHKSQSVLQPQQIIAHPVCVSQPSDQPLSAAAAESLSFSMISFFPLLQFSLLWTTCSVWVLQIVHHEEGDSFTLQGSLGKKRNRDGKRIEFLFKVPAFLMDSWGLCQAPSNCHSSCSCVKYVFKSTLPILSSSFCHSSITSSSFFCLRMHSFSLTFSFQFLFHSPSPRIVVPFSLISLLLFSCLLCLFYCPSASEPRSVSKEILSETQSGDPVLLFHFSTIIWSLPPIFGLSYSYTVNYRGKKSSVRCSWGKHEQLPKTQAN